MRDGENGVHRGASETECHEVPQTFPLHVNALAISGSGAAEWAFPPPLCSGLPAQSGWKTADFVLTGSLFAKGQPPS